MPESGLGLATGAGHSYGALAIALDAAVNSIVSYQHKAPREARDEWGLIWEQGESIPGEQERALSDINVEVRAIRDDAWSELRSAYTNEENFSYLFEDSWEIQAAFLPFVEEIIEIVTVRSGGRYTLFMEAIAKRNGGIIDVVTLKTGVDPDPDVGFPEGESFVEWHLLPETWEDPDPEDCDCLLCTWAETIFNENLA